ncbi:HAMP domain-containing histidine kinase [Comamonas sp. CAH-2]|uniref:sensor histidine kinase n=1 Tax=Comamonas sp. CAH-2 TaxID=2605745 RepID=UPI0012AD53BB|nr:HAMP domain-containing sensor histidine kinase [Comamonas sp. CAH-2]MRT20306.1 HAMP domain-containing histidine kinase [Comamonas sp. CAH-2]
MSIPKVFPIIEIPEFKINTIERFKKPSECNLDEACKYFYNRSLDGHHLCPKGFSSTIFTYSAKRYAIYGLIVHPRFDDQKQRLLSKKYTNNKTSIIEINEYTKSLREIEEERTKQILSGLEVFPQAFHELRKLNSLVLQKAEIEIGSGHNTKNMKAIKGAAELIRNNFDILEALSNIEGMKALPKDNSIKIFSLAFKMKRILEDLAHKKGMRISVEGDVEAELKGSSKSFPIILATLIENAIKYGRDNSDIDVTIIKNEKRIEILIENYSDENIDPERCFDRGIRFSEKEEGGGFGLFLAKEIVKIHGGNIKCIFNKPLVSMSIIFD